MFLGWSILLSDWANQIYAFYVFVKLKLTHWGDGVRGWVSDRDAQHRPLTRNATKGQNGCSDIGVETMHIFWRPLKKRGGGGAYVVTFIYLKSDWSFSTGLDTGLALFRRQANV